jgi:phosphoesterase family protein/putative Ig domain-containing protein/immunoglobulin I-set domain protein/Ig-like domain-containing protein
MCGTRSSTLAVLGAVMQLVAACSGSAGVSPSTPTVTAPTITTQPASQTLTAGQSASFSVSASGTAPLAYQWKKGGAPISGATSNSYSTGPTTAGENGAIFTVTVSNSAGAATSDPADLTVNPAPLAPAITAQPKSVTVTAGQSATFAVTASGTAPLQYQWNRNGSAIAGAIAANYTITATSTADNGAKFNVAVTNTAGSLTSNDAVLTVTAPTLTVTTSSLPNGVAGTAYSATLHAGGGTSPYTWSVNSGQLPAALALSASGEISGTPATAETSSFTIGVHDAAGAAASRALSIKIGAAAAEAPFGHVVIVVEENADYSTVIGNTASMPYLNSLIASYGNATQYYANTHPSIGNYEMLVTGEVLTNDDGETPASFPISVNNIVRELLANGKTWKAYAESIPSVGYIGGNSGNYYVRHVPLAYLTDVQDSATNRQGLVPFTQFAADIAAGKLPNFSFVTPNACDDAHNCPLSTADKWLETNIAPLLASTPFSDDGLLIITFDESGNDDTHGGGRIPAVFISPAFSKRGYQSTTLYQHQSTLRLMLEGLGIQSLPGDAATAPAMWEFFTFPAPR